MQSTTSQLALEHGELPAVRRNIVAQDVDSLVVATNLEVFVIWIKPPVQGLDHLNLALAEKEPLRCLICPMTGVALDSKPKGIFSHDCLS